MACTLSSEKTNVDLIKWLKTPEAWEGNGAAALEVRSVIERSPEPTALDFHFINMSLKFVPALFFVVFKDVMTTFTVDNNPDLESIPDEIGLCKRLWQFSCCKTGLSSLPNSITDCTSLAYLSVGHTTRMRHLPDNLGKLTKLDGLDCMDTVIEELPTSIGSCESLYWIDVRNCEHLTTIPDELGSCTKLSSLILTNTPVCALPKTITSCIGLEKIYIQDCKKLEELPEDIYTLPNLKYLYCSGSGLKRLPLRLGCAPNFKGIFLDERVPLDDEPDLKSLTTISDCDKRHTVISTYVYRRSLGIANRLTKGITVRGKCESASPT